MPRQIRDVRLQTRDASLHRGRSRTGGSCVVGSMSVTTRVARRARGGCVSTAVVIDQKDD